MKTRKTTKTPYHGGTQYASVTTKRCPMFDPACAARVAEYVAERQVQPFTVADALALIETACGRYARGAHKGHLRGWASIQVVTEGGWLRHGPGEGNGRVVYPNTVLEVSVGNDFSGETYLTV